jgi:uncharacterized short protein YbdD (DUF466 family)
MHPDQVFLTQEQATAVFASSRLFYLEQSTHLHNDMPYPEELAIFRYRWTKKAGGKDSKGRSISCQRTSGGRTSAMAAIQRS